MASQYTKVSIFVLCTLSLPFFIFGNHDLRALLDRQEQQLNKLEDLVATLSATVSKLESKLHRQSDLDRAVRGGVAVTKNRNSWLDRFQFLAAARLQAEVTAVTVLPFVDGDGFAKYFAVGDVNGRFYVFSSVGDLVVESTVSFDSPVTALLSYLPWRRNQSILVTGHADGSLVAHSIMEAGTGEDDWFVSLSIGSSQAFVNCGETGPASSPVVLLEVYHIGRARLIVSSDSAGIMRVFAENGTMHGSAAASSKPLAFMKQRMVFLTESGVGWLDLRRMVVKESRCEGLDRLVVRSYVFDALERTKAYGFTDEGDMVHVVLVGDASNVKCRVRAKKKLDIDGPVSALAIRGYLLVANQEKVFLYNVSSQFYSKVGASQPLLLGTLVDMRSLFLNSDKSQFGSAIKKPLVAGDREKLVVLRLGDGHLVIYHSNFPAIKVRSNVVLWSSPALVFLMSLFGISYLYVNKRGTIGLTPDESTTFSSPISESSDHLEFPSDDKTYTESLRGGELRDMRGSVLRDSRRYGSPSSRYPGGSAVSYRSISVDPGFGGATDLQYRGQGLEIAGLAKRREHIFLNSQSVDDPVR